MTTPSSWLLTENIGYDSTGRKTFDAVVEWEEPGNEKDRNTKLRPLRLPCLLPMEQRWQWRIWLE